MKQLLNFKNEFLLFVLKLLLPWPFRLKLELHLRRWQEQWSFCEIMWYICILTGCSISRGWRTRSMQCAHNRSRPSPRASTKASRPAIHHASAGASGLASPGMRGASIGTSRVLATRTLKGVSSGHVRTHVSRITCWLLRGRVCRSWRYGTDKASWSWRCRATMLVWRSLSRTSRTYCGLCIGRIRGSISARDAAAL